MLISLPIFFAFFFLDVYQEFSLALEKEIMVVCHGLGWQTSVYEFSESPPVEFADNAGPFVA